MPPNTDIRTASRAKLTIFSDEHLLVGRVNRFLGALEDAYTSLCELEASLPQEIDILWGVPGGPSREQQAARRIRTLLEGKPLQVPKGDYLLVFGRVQVNSPGLWEFLGRINPFEVIRKGLNDFHERRKDKDYKENAEAEQLRLRNLLLQAEVIREWTKTLREMGATEEEIQQILIRWVETPLQKLGAASVLFANRIELDRGRE